MNKTEQLRLIRSMHFQRNYKTIEELSTLSEDHLQAAVCTLLDHEKLLYYAIPNGVSKSKFAQAIFKYTGLISGVPDLLVCKRNKQYGGLYLELKHAQNILSPNQRAFIKKLMENGYQCEIIRSLKQAQKVIFGYVDE